ncbi:MAG: glutamate 5-kinase [Actinomycetota bacterium]|nr:glutamate 5-kinase [Actinomycetota bacterium]
MSKWFEMSSKPRVRGLEMPEGGRRQIPVGRPVVMKAGSSSLVHRSGELDLDALARTVDIVAGMWEIGYPTLLVSSGAVAAGLPVLGLERRPNDVAGFQVAAAIGQGRLMERYTAFFAAHDMVVGQVLLTKDLLANRSQYLNARSALERMLALGVVPIINENDTVVVEGLRLGDNDRLAAIVSHLVKAGILIILTDTEGIYSADPRTVEDAELLTAVHPTDRALDGVIGDAGPFGSGGAATKIAAARMAAWSGIPTVIASAGEPDVAIRSVSGGEVGTWVNPHETRLPARKLWIAFGQPSEGRVTVDQGATGALLDGGKSLLAVGVVSVEGEFSAEAAVDVVGLDGQLIGTGLMAMTSDQARRSIGRHSSEVGGVVIHRDDFVLLVPDTEPADRLVP